MRHHHKPPPPINHRSERWILFASLGALAAIAGWIIIAGGH